MIPRESGIAARPLSPFARAPPSPSQGVARKARGDRRRRPDATLLRPRTRRPTCDLVLRAGPRVHSRTEYRSRESSRLQREEDTRVSLDGSRILDAAGSRELRRADVAVASLSQIDAPMKIVSAPSRFDSRMNAGDFGVSVDGARSWLGTSGGSAPHVDRLAARRSASDRGH